MKAMARKAANISVAVLCFVQPATAALNSDENDQDSDACRFATCSYIAPAPAVTHVHRNKPQATPLAFDSASK